VVQGNMQGRYSSTAVRVAYKYYFAHIFETNHIILLKIMLGLKQYVSSKSLKDEIRRHHSP